MGGRSWPAAARGSIEGWVEAMAETVHGLTWADVAQRHGIDAALYPLGDGWAELMERLLTDLEAMGWHMPTPIRCEEKCGYLCFEIGGPTTYGGWPSEWEQRVTQAEEESDQTCTQCGRLADEVVIRGWVHKLCEACAERLSPAS